MVPEQGRALIPEVVHDSTWAFPRIIRHRSLALALQCAFDFLLRRLPRGNLGTVTPPRGEGPLLRHVHLVDWPNIEGALEHRRSQLIRYAGIVQSVIIQHSLHDTQPQVF